MMQIILILFSLKETEIVKKRTIEGKNIRWINISKYITHNVFLWTEPLLSSLRDNTDER